MKSLRADFLTDDRLRLFTGARCELPTGEIVEVTGRRTPFYDLARELDARGWGEWDLQVYTPTGTPSLRGRVKDLAGLTVTERSKGGSRVEAFQKFRGWPVQRQEPVPGARSTRGGLTAPCPPAAPDRAPDLGAAVGG